MKGATLQRLGYKRLPLRFNPRAREGRDLFDQEIISWPPCFNPRAREGRDHLSGPKMPKGVGFNPRAREGRDLKQRGEVG